MKPLVFYGHKQTRLIRDSSKILTCTLIRRNADHFATANIVNHLIKGVPVGVVEHSVKLRECYVTLQVDRTAALDEVKLAYRRLARLYHPDLNPGDPAAAERFRVVNAAYETLSSHLAVITRREARSVEAAAPKQTSSDRSDWEGNEAYSSFVDVLLGNLRRDLQN